MSFSEFFNSKEIKISFAAAAIALALFLFANSLVAFKKASYIDNEYEPQATITVRGKGEIIATPDKATFTITIKEQADTLKQAQQLATEKSNKITQYLKDKDVKKEKIKTISYNSYPEYEWERNCKKGYDCESKRVLKGYAVVHTIKVELDDLDKANELISGVSSFNPSNVSSLRFEVEDIQELQRLARAKAIEDAKAQAKELARELGVDLGRLVSYSEGGYGGGPIYPVMRKSLAAFEAQDAPEPIELSPGEEKITATVNLTYEIR